MICVLLGIVPPLDNDIREQLWGQVTSIKSSDYDEYDENSNGEFQKIQWASHSLIEDDDAGGVLTLLMTVNTEAPPETVVSSVQEAINRGGETNYTCELWASAPAPLPIKNGRQKMLEITDALEAADIYQGMRKWGVLVQRNVVSCSDDDSSEADNDFQYLKHQVTLAIATIDEQLRIHRPNIKVGEDNFLFREIASRSPHRFDLRLDSNEWITEWIQTRLLSQKMVSIVLNQCLGDDIDFDVSVVYSCPGAPHQGWHADGKHQRGAQDAGWENSSLADAYALCLFIPLMNLDETVGYTQFWPGSHRYRDLLGFGKVAEITKTCWNGFGRAGDGIWYDYRLFHRGMPNTSNNITRPVLQVIFKKKWYVEKDNYGEESVIDKGHGK